MGAVSNNDLEPTTELSALDCLEPLGAGASGQVVAGVLDGVAVACKLARPSDAEAPSDGYRRLCEEAFHLALLPSRAAPQLVGLVRVTCPKIQALLELEGPAAGLVMTHAPGRPLSTWLRDLEERARAPLALALARDVGAALSALHELGLAHGDVKPANIVVAPDAAGYRCTLVDYSLCDDGQVRVPRGGTPRYLPESDDLGDGRSRDLLALGLLLLETSVPGASTHPKPASLVRALEDNTPLAASIKRLLGPASLRPSALQLWSAAAPEEDAERRRMRVRQSYLRQRRSELQQHLRARTAPEPALAGTEADWLAPVATLLKSARAHHTPGSRAALQSLSEGAQRDWLMRLLGPGAGDPLPRRSAEALAARLLELADLKPLAAVTSADLEAESPSATRRVWSAWQLALELGHDAVDPWALTCAEMEHARGALPEALILTCASALRRQNELGRAWTLLERERSAAAALQRAMILLRARRFEQAKALLETMAQEPHPKDLEEQLSLRAALLARTHLALGDAALAAAALSTAELGAASCESNAMVALAQGDLAAAEEHVRKGLSLPHDAEQHGRLQALLAHIAQRCGQGLQALEHFTAATAAAARARAVVEEATYLGGVASAAIFLGDIKRALSAAERSLVLLEYLERSAEGARAALTLAVAWQCVGAQVEAARAAQRSLQLAQLGGDDRCQAYARWVLADVDEKSASTHLEAARALLTPAGAADRLRIAARSLRAGHGRAPAELAAVDATAAQTQDVDAALEWWTARARTASEEDLRAVVSAVQRLSHAPTNPDTLGQAALAAARCALRLGDEAADAELRELARRCAQTLLAHCPAQRTATLRSRPWIQDSLIPREEQLSRVQLEELQQLAVTLSERGALRPLLVRIVDAMVRWTGAERGLLLLRAPDGALKIRAARNLGRRDLSEHQRQLSTTLSQRALRERSCVVATDAAGELTDLSESVHALALRSVLAVPLIAQGEAIGVVYLDDRIRTAAFGERELAWVKLVSTLAAVALLDAREQLKLRRQALKTARAERRLAALVGEQQKRLEAAEQELAARRSETRYRYAGIIGQSEAMMRVLRLVDRVAPSELPVLVLGESGTGKELIARAIHEHSPRADLAFVAENCSAIPEPLLESTLFGHTRGAFTGATRDRPGLFELADRGTLFLDEVGEMSLAMQSKLLRVLETGELRRVGGEQSIRVDVRVIGATHRDLAAAVKRGGFREDLFYRLNVVSVRLPPLRERTSDITLLVEHFIQRYAKQVPPPELAPGTLSALERAAWPGNVRQLENAIRRALILCDDQLQPQHFMEREGHLRPEGDTLRDAVDALERDLITRALREAAFNQTRAAERLGVSRFGLQKMMRRLDIAPERPGRSQLEP